MVRKYREERVGEANYARFGNKFPLLIKFIDAKQDLSIQVHPCLLYTSKGTNVLPLTMNKKNVTGAEGQNGLFASAVFDNDKNELIVKVANTSATIQPITLNFEGLKKQDVLSNGRCRCV